jgi:hypothetical protein
VSDIQSNSSIINSPTGGGAVGGGTKSEGQVTAGRSSESAKAVTPKSAKAAIGAKRRDKGSTFSPDYGKRTMKSYPITEGELNELFMIGIVVTFLFSLGAGFFSFAVNIYKDLSFNPLLTREIIDHWTNVLWGCTFAGVIFVVIGVLVVLFGRNKIAKIKNETTFNES